MGKNEKNNLEQEFKGRNLEDAISLAEHVLKLSRDQVNYEVVAEKTKLFGIGSKEIVIRTWPKKKSGELAVTDFLDKLLALYTLDINYYTKKKNDMIYIIFDGADKHLLLWKDGLLLLSFQHILNKVSTKKVQTDCDFFRQRKERELKDYAQHIANQVQKSGQNEILDLMNPYERRIVHVAINQVPGITTESIGDGFMKKIRIFHEKR